MGLPTFLIPRTAPTNSLQRLTAAACVVIFGSTTVIFGFKKEHFCQGSIRLQTSQADLVGDARRASEVWSAPVGGDSRAGTGLSVYINRVTSKMPPTTERAPPAFSSRHTPCSLYPKIWERWAGHVEVQRRHSAFALPSDVYRRCSRLENTYTRSMSTFEVDEIALESTWEANGPSSHRDRPRRPGGRLPSSSQSAHMSGDWGCQGEVALPSVPPQNLQTIELV
jgi:hypothetical protein